MRLRKVRLYNFSSYAGENTIDLTTDQTHNIILIGGNNGAGKTSLFTAIKLVLYGPQCFRFQDKNNQYTARIKDLINHDAYMDSEVKAYVEMEIDVPGDRERMLYTLRRSWIYSDKRLNENYTVVRNGEALNDKDKDFFQNYLFTIIPPNLFEFFFFDGEEIGDFFSTSYYHRYIKNAVMTLCGYDTFNVIKRFCDSYISEERNNEDYDRTAATVRDAERELAALRERITYWKDLISRTEAALQNSNSEQKDLKQRFKQSGGLSEKEQRDIQEQMESLERIKAEGTQQIREFAENTMPLYIVGGLAGEAYEQLMKEREVSRYRSVMQQLSAEILEDIIRDIRVPHGEEDTSFAHRLSEAIADRLRPEVDLSVFENLHDLSQEQENQMISLMVQLENFQEKEMIEICRKKKAAGQEYEKLSRLLRESLPEVDANTYMARIDCLEGEIQRYKRELQQAATELSAAEQECKDREKACDRLRKMLREQARNQTAHIYTSRISQVMQEMVREASHEKFKKVEDMAIQMFHQIIRKENFVELIELDDDFNINLYKKQTYSGKELAALLQNIGMEELEKRLGTRGIQRAVEHFALKTAKELKAYLLHNMNSGQMDIMDNQPLDLYKRMELNQLSKGEKQVFIMSLYWAIIKTSGQSVPFIIDTPFARIDTEHREQIAGQFLPGISEQVIILSTDEEVVGSYREALSPYIAHEYILDYVAESGQTAVRSGYFGEVSL